MKTESPWGIHWFRRDLRLPGNEALRENWKITKGRTLGLFCFDSKFLSRADFSHNRFAFFLQSLQALKNDWREQGGDLLVVDCLPHEAFPQIFAYGASKGWPPPSVVSWGRDYEPFARQRHASLEALFKKAGIPIVTARDHLLFEPHEILKSRDPGDFYQIYSPFGRKWFAALAAEKGQERLAAQAKTLAYFERKGRRADLFTLDWKTFMARGDFPFTDALDKFAKQNQKHVTIPIPEAGFFTAYGELQKFRSHLKAYKEDRDVPSLRGTSRLSMFLKNGSLTTPQILQALELGAPDWNRNDGPTQFTKELAWREFYYSILFHRPHVETKSFLPQYENLRWENDEGFFKRWREGTTGFPIVDAGMRELLTTGWMHNRVRMIVASFLTKDLLIDWRWGENHFMKELLDGDLAPNNGGWQWAASTGCDPQPYFRVFNPWLQGQKFDPEGLYIKTHVPELRDVPPKALHDPKAERGRKYPAPIVDHSVRRDQAIRLYKN